MLTIQDLTYHIGARTLLNQTSLKIFQGQRVGLIGQNGSGKSTLFKLISGELSPDSGSIQLTKGHSIGMMRQDLPDNHRSLIDTVLAADTERAALLQAAEHKQDAEQLGQIFARLEEINAYTAKARAATILAGLGFDEVAQQKSIADFSGGWRMRVALAATLFLQPDLLLLDEPSNHLDFETTAWLENYLLRYQGTLIIISHERALLNKTVKQIIYLDQQKLTLYTGNYDQFEQIRAKQQTQQHALYQKQQAKKEKMMAFVTRFRAKATKARQAQSRLKMMEKMDWVEAFILQRTSSFTFPNPEPLTSPLIRLENINAGYQAEQAGPIILKQLNLLIDQGDRIALLGANGNGKSTLIKILARQLAPLQGNFYASNKLKIGYFAQFQTEVLDTTQTPYQCLQAAMPQHPESKVRAFLAQFGFDKFKADTLIAELSGGEKSRLLFGLMSHHAPHIMCLDEPTNHLDIDARAALVHALNRYTGAVILVSHDAYLIEAVADHLWVVKQGHCTEFDQDLSAYRQWAISERRLEAKPNAASTQNTQARALKHNPKITHDKTTQKIEQQAIKIEATLHQLHQQKAELEQHIALCYQKNDEQSLNQLQKDYQILEQKLQQAEAKFSELIDHL